MSGVEQHKYERIDKGRKRSKWPQRQRTAKGTFLPIVAPEKRAEIITDALQRLQHGEPTDSIAASYNIPGITLRYWLLNEQPEAAEQARKIYFDGELNTAREEIRAAADPLTLARAREDFRAVSWLAERRLPSVYGQKTHVTVENVGDLGDRLMRARQRVIDVTPNSVSLPSQVTDSQEK